MSKISNTRFLDVPFEELVDFKDRPRDADWFYFRSVWETERRGKEIGIKILGKKHPNAYCKRGRTFTIVTGPGIGEPTCSCVAAIGD